MSNFVVSDKLPLEIYVQQQARMHGSLVFSLRRHVLVNTRLPYTIVCIAMVSSFLVKNTDGLWFQLQWWEFFKNAENTLAMSKLMHR